MRTKLVGILGLCMLVGLPPAAAVAQPREPLVIVVHGIGGGNRDDSWAAPLGAAWGVPVRAVTYRYEGRTETISMQDFLRHGAEWAESVKTQIDAAIRENPGRRVVIVSHSWGSAATKMAMMGGGASGNGDVPTIQFGDSRVAEWITLGSPIGLLDKPLLAANQKVDVPAGKPPQVDNWTNFYDVNDLIARASHNLAGATNIPVGVPGGENAISAHTQVWYKPDVVKHIKNTFRRLSALPPLNPIVSGSIQFRARTQDGKPVGGAQITLAGAERSPVERVRTTVRTDAAGLATVTGFVSGPYTVVVTHPACERIETTTIHLQARDSRPVTMKCRTEPASAVDFELGIDGPGDIAVGQVANLTATIKGWNGNASLEWLLPNGLACAANRTTCAVSFARAGSYRVGVVVTALSGGKPVARRTTAGTINVHEAVREQPRPPARPTPRSDTRSAEPSDAQWVAAYQALLPAVLQAERKPWQTHIDMLANAVAQGRGYHVNYKTFCVIENGPDKGKDYPCFEFDSVLDLGQIKTAVADFRRRLGR